MQFISIYSSLRCAPFLHHIRDFGEDQYSAPIIHYLLFVVHVSAQSFRAFDLIYQIFITLSLLAVESSSASTENQQGPGGFHNDYQG